MLNYYEPLTQAESDFAAEHHELIFGYLNQAGLSEDDFYDIAVFGYLRAVRKYLARAELRRYSFSTIAYRAMSRDVHHSRKYWLRQKRRAEVISFNEELHTPDLADTVAETCEKVISFQELTGKLTGTQRKIVFLRCEGYRDREITTICRLAPGELDLEMNRARANVVPFTIKTAAAAA